ncbi:hypothetical protein ACTFIY_008653 [Dictyostelium cf. discoideum]
MDFNRVDPGPMSIDIVVKDLYMEKNYIHCFPAIITSISSVSNELGGIVTIKGSKLSSTLNSSLIPTITIECKLDPNESGGKKLSVDVNFNGCNSTSSGSSPVTFTYNTPTLLSGSYSNGIVTLIGKNLGNYDESFIQLNENTFNKKIKEFNTSPDEKSLTFKLPHLRCKSFYITFNTDGIASNILSISFFVNQSMFNTIITIDIGILSINGNNFGNSKSMAQVYFNNNDISSILQSLNNNQFTFKILKSYKSGSINITIDGNNLESSFYLTLPPIINNIINKDNKTISCGSLITVSGNNLLTNDEEYKVKVLANNQDTTLIKHDENILIVKSDSNESPLNVSVFIGNDLIISNVILTYLEPIITVIPNIKKNNMFNTLLYLLTISSNENDNNNTIIPLECNLQCSPSTNDTFYYKNTILSSNEIDITNYTDRLSIIIEVIHNETSLVFKFLKDRPYVSRLVMYKDRDTQRTDFPNYFDCTLIIGEFRYYYGSVWSRVCAREVSSPRVDCLSNRIIDISYVPPVNVKFSRLPPTSGGDVVITGGFIRFDGGPNTLSNSISYDNSLEVKGDFSDPSFNSNSITVSFPPGSGPFKQMITIDGDNFFTLKNFNRTDLGPMYIRITVNRVSTQKDYIHYFPALITSITSVSNDIGGIQQNLGNNKESFIQLYSNEINTKIDKFDISSDQKSLTFKLPQLRSKLFNINFARNDISLKTISISASLSINVINKPSLLNGTLFIELYYIDCPISSSLKPTFTVGDSLTNQYSIQSLQSSKSEQHVQYHMVLVSIDNSHLNIIQSQENKTLSCGSIISVSGNNLLTNDEEFKVTVLSNNHDTTLIKHDENLLLVKYDSNESPLNVSVFIGNDLIISNVILTYLEPIITVIPNIKKNNMVFQ